MEIKESLGTLLRLHMNRVSVGDARLASQVNSMMANPYFIHRSTLRNWRDGSSKKVNNWRQLVVVAAALNLCKNETNELLESACCPPLSALTATAQESDQRIFNQWRGRTDEATN